MPEEWSVLRRLRTGLDRVSGLPARPGHGSHRRDGDPGGDAGNGAAVGADSTGRHARVPADAAGPGTLDAGTGPARAPVRRHASGPEAPEAPEAPAPAAAGPPSDAETGARAFATLADLMGEDLTRAATAAVTPGGRLVLPGMRAARAAAEVSAADADGRARLRALLDGAPPVLAAYLLSVLATGRGVGTVGALAEAVAAHRRDAGWLHRHLGVLDGAPGPATFEDDDGARLRLRQHSPVTCGPTSMILLRVLLDPAYAYWITTGARLDDRPSDGLPFEQRFRTQQARVHDAVTHRGLGPAPWPRFLGSPPRAVARFLNKFTGLTGARYAWQAAGPGTDLVTPVLDAVAAGIPTPLYVEREGDRTVVLAFACVEDRLRLYDPARGEIVDAAVVDLRTGRLGPAGDRLEGAVVPHRPAP